MQGTLDGRAKLASPAKKEDEERDEKRLSKADRTARPTSSATFSTASDPKRSLNGLNPAAQQWRRAVLVLSCRLASPTSTLVHRAVAYALNHVMPDKTAPI
jgi:hypothetical protein